MTWVLYLIILCATLSIAYGVWTTRAVLASDPGTARMQEIAAAIQEGAQAYLARQYTTIAVVGVVIFLILAYLLGITQAIGFAFGAILSGAAGYIGMNVSVRANVRTAQAATKSLADGLSLAFRSIGDAWQPKFARSRGLRGHLGMVRPASAAGSRRGRCRQKAARQFRDVLYQGKQPADSGGQRHAEQLDR